MDVNTKEGHSPSSVEKLLMKCSKLHFYSYKRPKKLGILEKEVLKIINDNYFYHTHDEYDNPQAAKGKRRSFGDIYRLLYHCTNTHVKVEDLLKVLGKLVNDNAIASYHCGVIKKRVFHLPTDRLLENTNCIITADGDKLDEFGWKWPAKSTNMYIGGTRLAKLLLLKENFE